MGGHGHGPPYVVPSADVFKTEGIPQLQELETALARKGLKDPWIRNEAWRYNKGFGTKWARGRAAFLRGAPLGLALAIVTTIIDKGLSSGDHGHGHAEH